MGKNLKITIIIISSILLLSTIYLAVFEASLNYRLVQKDLEVDRLNNQVIELQKQLDNEHKVTLVTSLGISTEPRNNTEYPHPHFTVDGSVFNVGSETAYNARLRHNCVLYEWSFGFEYVHSLGEFGEVGDSASKQDNCYF